MRKEIVVRYVVIVNERLGMLCYHYTGLVDGEEESSLALHQAVWRGLFRVRKEGSLHGENRNSLAGYIR